MSTSTSRQQKEWPAQRRASSTSTADGACSVGCTCGPRSLSLTGNTLRGRKPLTPMHTAAAASSSILREQRCPTEGFRAHRAPATQSPPSRPARARELLAGPLLIQPALARSTPCPVARPSATAGRRGRHSQWMCRVVHSTVEPACPHPIGLAWSALTTTTMALHTTRAAMRNALWRPPQTSSEQPGCARAPLAMPPSRRLRRFRGTGCLLSGRSERPF